MMIETNPWRETVLWVWRQIQMFPAATGWLVLGMTLALQTYPQAEILSIPSGVLIAVVLWVVVFLIGLGKWDEDLEWLAFLLPRGDFKRWKGHRQASVDRRDGYQVALALGLVSRIENEREALKRPLSFLPKADLMHGDEFVELDVVQEVGATTAAILDAAEAYAPVVRSKPEWTRFERPEPDRAVVTWWTGEPVDPLREPVRYEDHWVNKGIPIMHDPFRPVPIGVDEAGEPFCVQIFGRQILTIGQSGSGKGSVLWSVMLGIAPWIRSGVVRLYGIDLKGGVELSQGKELFHDLAFDYDDAIRMLALVSEELDSRLTTLREEGLRKWETPTRENPLILVVIDEAGSLAYQAPDAKTRAEADRLLKRLTSTGRAPGVSVLAALQDPRKESLMARDFFLDTWALRMSKAEVNIALAPWAYDAGAHTDRIPMNQAGTGFAINSETQEIDRFRAFWVSDELLHEYAQRFAAPVPD